VAYQFGISGPFWYAAGASIQLVLFGILVIELKRKAPSSHTFPEIINARFGVSAHKVFLFFALMTNTIVTAMLVLGGAAVIHSLTGVNLYLASFLIPVGVIVYTFLRTEGDLLRRISQCGVHLWSCSYLRNINLLSKSRFGRSGWNV
jgi:Na+/proline symporter